MSLLPLQWLKSSTSIVAGTFLRYTLLLFLCFCLPSRLGLWLSRSHVPRFWSRYKIVFLWFVSSDALPHLFLQIPSVSLTFSLCISCVLSTASGRNRWQLLNNRIEFILAWMTLVISFYTAFPCMFNNCLFGICLFIFFSLQHVAIFKSYWSFSFKILLLSCSGQICLLDLCFHFISVWTQADALLLVELC